MMVESLKHEGASFCFRYLLKIQVKMEVRTASKGFEVKGENTLESWSYSSLQMLKDLINILLSDL